LKKQAAPALREPRNFESSARGKVRAMASIVGAAGNKSLLLLFFRKEGFSSFPLLLALG